MSIVFMLFVKFNVFFVHCSFASSLFLMGFQESKYWGWGTLLADYTFFLNFCFAFCFVCEDF